LPATILSGYLRKKKLPIPLTVVVTDFDMHSLWAIQGAARYFVATEAIAYKLQKRGYRPDQISLTGIPIHPVFSKPLNRQQILNNMSLDNDIPRIMLLSGGFAMRQMQDTVAAIASIPTPLQILAVAGRNKKLKVNLDSMNLPDHVRLKTFPFISTIEELMEVSDFIITKPGGLSASECLAKNLVIIIFSPIPGQEERNSDYLLEAGAGVKVNSLVDLEFKLRYLLDHPERIQELRAAAHRIARPQAAFTIADEIHSMIL
jgi:processive 1,2-diacylglycerol beta-glucosyltransferase